MHLRLGPLDTRLHVRSRDHYAAVRREAKLLALAADTPAQRLDALLERLERQFPPSPVDELVDRAYRAGEPTFTVEQTIPDKLVPTALAACDELEALLAELDQWAEDPAVQLLAAPPEVRAYSTSYLAMARDQLRAGLARNQP